MPNTGERRFKRGQIICKPGEMDMNMYNILYGSVAVYKDYGTPEEVEVVTLSEGDFFNVISFLESRPATPRWWRGSRWWSARSPWRTSGSISVSGPPRS